MKTEDNMTPNPRYPLGNILKKTYTRSKLLALIDEHNIELSSRKSKVVLQSRLFLFECGEATPTEGRIDHVIQWLAMGRDDLIDLHKDLGAREPADQFKWQILPELIWATNQSVNAAENPKIIESSGSDDHTFGNPSTKQSKAGKTVKFDTEAATKKQKPTKQEYDALNTNISVNMKMTGETIHKRLRSTVFGGRNVDLQIQSSCSTGVMRLELRFELGSTMSFRDRLEELTRLMSKVSFQETTATGSHNQGSTLQHTLHIGLFEDVNPHTPPEVDSARTIQPRKWGFPEDLSTNTRGLQDVFEFKAGGSGKGGPR